MAINDHLQQKKNTLRNMCCSSALHRLLTVVRGQFERNKRVQVSDLYDNNWQLFSQKKAQPTNNKCK